MTIIIPICLLVVFCILGGLLFAVYALLYEIGAAHERAERENADFFDPPCRSDRWSNQR